MKTWRKPATAVDQVLSERLKTSQAQLRFISPEMLFLQGRDLWRSSPSLHKLAAQVRFAEIASELIEKKPLRLGYDQLIPAPAHMQSRRWEGSCLCALS